MKKCLLGAALFLLAAQAAIANPAGFSAVAIPSEHRGRDLAGAVFYPAAGGGRAFLFGDNAVLHGAEVLNGAGAADGSFPVVLVSHGLGGNTGTLGWLSAGLARKGAVVLSVNHPGSTTLDFNLREGVKHWTRAQDLRTALDWLAGEAGLSRIADFSRVYAVGFSFGGWTALSLGGLRADLEGYCRAAPPSPQDCASLARRGADLRTYAAEDWNASRKDDRIRAVAAIDPALTYGLGTTHVHDLVEKVLLIGLGTAETRLPATNFSKTGSGFAALLPGAEIEILAPAAHFSALLPCKPAGRAILASENDDPLCDDPPGADRPALHKQIIARIAQFLGL